MRKDIREVLGVLKREGFTVLNVDQTKGKGSHFLVEFAYGATVIKLTVGAKDTDRKKQNFLSDIRKIKREIVANGETA